jgi:hypothetical protein
MLYYKFKRSLDKSFWSKQLENKFFEKNIKIFLCLLVCIYAIIYYFSGDKLPVRGGLGWDGLVYGAYAKNFIAEISSNSDAYHVSRCFPSFLIWSICRVLRIHLDTPAAIFTAFYIFNNMCFLLIALVWNRICVFKKFSFEVFVFGFLCFFCNFIFFKYYQYAPVLTDVFALLLGMLALYFYVKDMYISLYLLLIPIMLTWPIGVVFIFILTVFNKIKSPLILSKRKFKYAFLIALIYGLIIIFLSHTEYLKNIYRLAGINDVAVNLSVLSASIASLYVFLIVKEVRFTFLSKKLISVNRLLIFICFFILAFSIYHYLLGLSFHNSTDPSALSSRLISTFLFIYVPTGPLIKPGIFLTMQVATWGPVTLLFIIYCKQMFKKAYNENLALVVLLLISFYFGLNPQYRFNTFLMPITIFLLCMVMQDLKINYKFNLWFGLIALFSSKIYLPLNVGNMPSEPSSYDLLHTGLQRFFMNSGDWVSWRGYYITLGLTVCTTIMIIFLIKHYFKVNMFIHWSDIKKETYR